MNKLIAFLLLLTLIIIPLRAVESEESEIILSNRLAKYPEVLVRCGEKVFSKKDAINLLKKQNLKNIDDNELAEILKETIEEQVYLEIVSAFLKKYDFSPSYQMAYDYLAASQAKMPTKILNLQNKNRKIEELASDKHYQLTVAALLYLKKYYPENTHVSADEIEFFYRVNQNIFMDEAKVSVSFLAIEKNQENSRETINHAVSQLKQGVAFEKLAEKFNENLPKKFYEPFYQARLLEKAAELDSGEYSEILEFADSYAIVMVRNREEPKYIPLSEVSFFIQSIIESRKCAIELEKILSEALESIKVEYFF
ncbi:MAG: peptidyl-prolyl cis-trans isomerase [Lentisphaeria bacterium]|nr:peptidyl-prolyl cis-trans isomerase [Lentisphaeria bacterium]